MRLFRLGLIMLFVPVVKIKEACKNRSGQQTATTVPNTERGVQQGDFQDRTDEDAPLLQEVHNSAHETNIVHFDLLIAGAGVQGWKSIAEFSRTKYKHAEKFRIGIVETKSKLGPGLPYDEDVVIPEHLLFFFEAVAETPHLEKYLPESEEIDETVDAYDRVVLKPPPPRYLEGQYIIDEFNKSVHECETYGYKIELMPLTTVVNIKRLHSGGFTVTLSGKHKGTVAATDIFLSTGHWYASRFGKNVQIEGYHESPWPASTLKQKITQAVHIAIFGNGQTGIDTAMILAHIFGEFEYRDKRFYFKIKKKYRSGNFKITMYSRSGHLPPVAGTPASEFPKYELAAKAMSLQQNGHSEKFFPLEDVLKLIKEDLAAVVPGISETTDRFDEMGAKELIDHINFYAYQNKDYKQRLSDDIAAARESVNMNKPLFIPHFFHYVANVFHIFLQYFSAEDTITFKKYIAPAISKWFAPIPPHNAEKLFALMNASCLFLEAVGDDSKVTPANWWRNGVLVKYNGKKIYHRYFIDAMGQSGDISKDPSQLTQNLIENGLIQPLYVPYNDTEREVGSKRI